MPVSLFLVASQFDFLLEFFVGLREVLGLAFECLRERRPLYPQYGAYVTSSKRMSCKFFRYNLLMHVSSKKSCVIKHMSMKRL